MREGISAGLVRKKRSPCLKKKKKIRLPFEKFQCEKK